MLKIFQCSSLAWRSAFTAQPLLLGVYFIDALAGFMEPLLAQAAQDHVVIALWSAAVAKQGNTLYSTLFLECVHGFLGKWFQSSSVQARHQMIPHNFLFVLDERGVVASCQIGRECDGKGSTVDSATLLLCRWHLDNRFSKSFDWSEPPIVTKVFSTL